LGRRSEWQSATALLKDMRRLLLEANLINYNATISTCVQGKQLGQALQLVIEMRLAGLAFDQITHHARSRAHRIGNQWRHIFGVLIDMWSERILPGAVACGVAVGAYVGSQQWESVLCLMEHKRVDRFAKDFPLDLVTYSTTVGACEKGCLWMPALGYLEEMQQEGLRPNVICYNAAASACSTSNWWEQALCMLQGLPRLQLEPSVTTYGTTADAYARRGDWVSGLNVLSSLSPSTSNAIILSAVISACEQSLQWGWALHLLAEIWLSSTVPDEVAYSTTISACEKGWQWQWVHCSQKIWISGPYSPPRLDKGSHLPLPPPLLPSHASPISVPSCIVFKVG
jgi:hypothetical protein